MPIPSLFDNRLTLPLIAAPMFLASGPELVSACCKAGIVGTFPAKNQRTTDGLEAWLDQITTDLKDHEQATGRPATPFGVNLIVHKSNDVLADELALCKKYNVPLIITSLGAVSDLVRQIHDYGGLVFHDVINLRHAEKASSAGVDGLIAVCAGAGGHTGQASPFGLINEIKASFDGTVLLSGALSTGADIAAAQMIGADLAYMGTRFISTKECLSPDAYKQMVVAAAASDIMLTDAITGVNANFIKQSLSQAGYDPDNLSAHGEVDINKELAEALDPRQNSAKPWRDLWSAGHGVGSITDTPPVAELVTRLCEEYAAAIAGQTERARQYL